MSSPVPYRFKFLIFSFDTMPSSLSNDLYSSLKKRFYGSGKIALPDNGADSAFVHKITVAITEDAIASDLPPQMSGSPALSPDYSLQEKLGSGGYGVVYRAFIRPLLECAVKVIPKKAMEEDDGAAGHDGAHLERNKGCYTEYEGVSRMQGLSITQNHLMTIFQVGENKNYLFYSMEYLKYTLKERMEEAVRQKNSLLPGGFAVEEILKIGHDILDALKDCHAANLAHMDLKPRNIGFDDKGVLKLMDYGLSCYVHDPLSGVPCTDYGTSDYTAKNAGKDGASNDLYATGVILGQLLCGKIGNRWALVEDFLKIPIRGIQARRLLAVIRKATDSEPSRRFATAQEFDHALSQVPLPVGKFAIAGVVLIFCVLLGHVVVSFHQKSAQQRLEYSNYAMRLVDCCGEIDKQMGDFVSVYPSIAQIINELLQEHYRHVSWADFYPLFNLRCAGAWESFNKSMKVGRIELYMELLKKDSQFYTRGYRTDLAKSLQTFLRAYLSFKETLSERHTNIQRIKMWERHLQQNALALYDEGKRLRSVILRQLQSLPEVQKHYQAAISSLTEKDFPRLIGVPTAVLQEDSVEQPQWEAFAFAYNDLPFMERCLVSVLALMEARHAELLNVLHSQNLEQNDVLMGMTQEALATKTMIEFLNKHPFETPVPIEMQKQLASFADSPNCICDDVKNAMRAEKNETRRLYLDMARVRLELAFCDAFTTIRLLENCGVAPVVSQDLSVIIRRDMPSLSKGEKLEDYDISVWRLALHEELRKIESGIMVAH